MYLPASFRVDNPTELASFLRQHSFATLVTLDDQTPFATHLPFLVRVTDGRATHLVGHVAKANPQWEHFASERDVLVIFQGPHAYISPAFYQTELAVPTWNYTAVHVYGRPKIIADEDQVATILQELVTIYEAPRSEPWVNRLPADFLQKLYAGIVAFEINITRLEGKFKLSQNRPAADRAGVIRELGGSSHPENQAVAQLMQLQEKSE